MADQDSMPDAGAPPQDFASTLERLEALVTRLESGELGLEASLEAFEQGVGLTREAQRRLDAAELKVRSLVEGADGELDEAPFAADSEGTR